MTRRERSNLKKRGMFFEIFIVLGVLLLAAAAAASVTGQSRGAGDKGQAVFEGIDLPLGFRDATADLYDLAEDDGRAARRLIEAGADVSARNRDGVTPLHQAALEGREATLAVLLEAGAELEARTADGYTPLAFACFMGWPRSAAILIAGGADVDARSSGDITPLHLAAGVLMTPRGPEDRRTFDERLKERFPGMNYDGDFPGTTQTLLEAGGDPDARCGEGILYDCGGNRLGEEFFGKTPLDFAILVGNDRVVEYLRSQGATTALEPERK